MKKTIIILILFFSISSLSGCTERIYHTPVEWCILDVLHNEPYDDGDSIDAYKYEKLYIADKDENFYNMFCYIVTVIYTNEVGDVQFDYWYCFIAIKQRCVHGFFDYFRDKHSENAHVCQYCIELDCDWFKSETIQE